MNKITKKTSFSTLLMGVSLVIALSACSDTKTASDAPKTTENNAQVTTDKNVKTTQDDAQSEVRKKQLEADIRAREQRNNAGGDPQKRTEGDLASEVRSKLEANIPNGKLTVTAKDAEVTIAGVVPKQDQLDKIKALAMEIKGVKTVTVKAVVSP
jgi:hyperosmotically inducible periplasmic protein